MPLHPHEAPLRPHPRGALGWYGAVERRPAFVTTRRARWTLGLVSSSCVAMARDVWGRARDTRGADVDLAQHTTRRLATPTPAEYIPPPWMGGVCSGGVVRRWPRSSSARTGTRSWLVTIAAAPG